MEAPVPAAHRSSERDSEHHVHFSESGEDGDALPPTSCVDVVPDGDKIAIHAGFLKAMHQYRVTCCVPLACHEWVPADMPALHWRVRHMRPVDDGATELTLQVTATKEKLLREKLMLSKADDSGQAVTLELNARILGKNIGTPFLRDGVHLEGVIKEDEGSEASDWRGFD